MTDTKAPKTKKTAVPKTKKAAAPTPQVPELAGVGGEDEKKPEPEAPEDPNCLGQMEPGELAMMTTLRQQTRKLQTDIGGLELQKARLIGGVGQIEQQLEHHLSMVGQRLGIPQGQKYQIGPDGKCWLVPMQGQMPQGLRRVPDEPPKKG